MVDAPSGLLGAGQDSGEAVAVVCCDLGDLFYRGARPIPEEVTISWQDFAEAGERLADQQRMIARALELLDAGAPQMATDVLNGLSV